jgi:hypothetical protein
VVNDPVNGVDPTGLVDENHIEPSNSFEDFILYWAMQTWNHRSYYTIGGHGIGGALLISGDIEKAAERAKKSGKSEILLVACEQGNGQYGNTAQYLANESGLPVKYNTGNVNPIVIMPNGLPLAFGSWTVAYPQSQTRK